MEKISDKNCPKFQKKLPDLNERVRVYCPNKEKKLISRTQFYDPLISRIHKIMSKICPKFVQNFSTYTRVYTVALPCFTVSNCIYSNNNTNLDRVV